MSNRYRMGIVGCGGRGKAHAVGLLADSRCDIVAVVDPDRDAAKALTLEYGFQAKTYSSHQEMLDVERPDVVVSATWTGLHLPVFQSCVDHGVRAVLSEKPMAPTWGECCEMSRLADQSGTMLTFCHQRRYAKGNLLARKLIADGCFGKVEKMDLYSPPNLLDCGTHTFDQALSFNDEITAKWVLCAVDTSSLVHWFDVTAESVAAGVVVFQNNVRAAFQFGGPDLDIWGGVRVVGDEGFLEIMWDGQFRRVVRYDDPAWKPAPEEDDQDDAMRCYVKDTLDALEQGREPELSHRKALRAAEIIFACYESVRRRARVELPLSGFDDNPLHALLRGSSLATNRAH